MPVVIASGELSDVAFLAALDNCSLPPSCFRHGDHLRFAWLLLHAQPFDSALASVTQGIKKYAAHLGMPYLFHETLTTAWVHLLSTHHESSFAEFVRHNEYRLTRELLHRFWTPSALDSQAARTGWLPPDKHPLPT